MVASHKTQTDTCHATPAVETRPGAHRSAEPGHGTVWPGIDQQHPWHAQYHEGPPARSSFPQQRLGAGGAPQCLQRPGRGRR